MIKLRAITLKTADRILRRRIFRNFKLLQTAEYESSEILTRLYEEKLRSLMLHSYKNVPYYNKVLGAAAVVKDGAVYLENFEKIPILTKDVIRQQRENLYSEDYRKRSSYRNTSGGSTGEPVSFIQDLEYKDWGFACAFYLNLMAGKKVGEPEVKLWGSERDIFRNATKLRTRIDRWLFNVTFLNSFLMSEKNMSDYVKEWNKAKPKLVRAYTSSIFELAKYVRRTGAKIFQPDAIICSAETLTEDVRTFVQEVFGCCVLNHYGSREVGAIACECPQQQGLHTFPVNNVVEIVDDNLRPCKPGQTGEVFVTTLNNYSMPLIRYQIGDTAIQSEAKRCACGRVWPLIASVTGRRADHFKTKEGTLVHGEYFTHLFYDKQNVTKFQVVQCDYEKIEILTVSQQRLSEAEHKDIIDKIRLVMGQGCEVAFKQVDDISRTKSGKYRYTISEVT